MLRAEESEKQDERNHRRGNTLIQDKKNSVKRKGDEVVTAVWDTGLKNQDSFLVRGSPECRGRSINQTGMRRGRLAFSSQ